MTVAHNFEQLASPHLQAAYNLAYWITRSRPDAEDVVQDAYLRAWRAFGGLRGEDMRPWLLAIVRNAAYRWMSTRRRAGNVISLDTAFIDDHGEQVTALEVASVEPSAETRLIAADARARLAHALGELPPVFREILILREIEELSYREIAEVTGTLVGTVMSRLSRARAELRRTLSAAGKKDAPHAL